MRSDWPLATGSVSQPVCCCPVLVSRFCLTFNIYWHSSVGWNGVQVKILFTDWFCISLKVLVTDLLNMQCVGLCANWGKQMGLLGAGGASFCMYVVFTGFFVVLYFELYVSARDITALCGVHRCLSAALCRLQRWQCSDSNVVHRNVCVKTILRMCVTETQNTVTATLCQHRGSM